MTISFDGIPGGIRTPGQFLEVNNSRAVQGSPAQPHKALVIAQRMTGAGSVAAEIPTLVPSDDAGESFFGAGSHIAMMLQAFKAANRYTELWAVALDDEGAGTLGTTVLTFTGPASADGVVYLQIGNDRVTVAVANEDTAAEIAGKVDAAIKAHRNYARMPYTSAQGTDANTHKVTLTARNKGTVGNGVETLVNYRQGESLPAGVGLTIEAGVTGATDPDIQDALDVLGDVQYNTVVTSLADATNLQALSAYLATRWTGMDMKDGHAFAAAKGDLSGLQGVGEDHNSPHLVVWEIGGTSGNSPTPVFVAAAGVAAVDAFQTGIDPLRPRQTLAVPGVLPPKAQYRFDREERDTLLNSGIATHTVDDGGVVRIERLITTYQTNPADVIDPSYLDTETLRDVAAKRYDVVTMLSLKYPRHKLANDGTLFDPGQAVVTPSTIRAEIIKLARGWERQARLENIEQFKADLIVERDANDPDRINYQLAPDLVNGFRIGAGQIQFLL